MFKKIFIALLFVTTSTFAATQQPIKLIVPYSPGGASDIIARLIQHDLEEKLKRTVIIEYKLGAGGDVGTAYVANASKNETLLILHSVGMIINSVTKPPVFTTNNLHHVVTIGSSPMVLVASNKLKIKNLNELATLKKSSISYASAGVGTGSHLAGELLKNSTGQNMTHIPYKGSAAAIPDVISGNIDISFMHYNLIYPYIKSGQVVPLAVGSIDRLNSLPNIPTFRESRYYDAEYRHWFAIFSNKDGNNPESRAIIAVFQKILSNPITKLPYQEAGLTVDLPIEINNINFINNQKTHYKNLLENINLQ